METIIGVLVALVVGVYLGIIYDSISSRIKKGRKIK